MRLIEKRPPLLDEIISVRNGPTLYTDLDGKDWVSLRPGQVLFVDKSWGIAESEPWPESDAVKTWGLVRNP